MDPLVSVNGTLGPTPAVDVAIAPEGALKMKNGDASTVGALKRVTSNTSAAKRGCPVMEVRIGREVTSSGGGASTVGASKRVTSAMSAARHGFPVMEVRIGKEVTGGDVGGKCPG